MKPKFRNLFQGFPALIFIAASVPSAHAAIFNDDSGGNAQPTAADNGATTIVADGGTSSSPFVNIGPGVNITGDAGETEVVQISGINYTVTNNGILAGTNHQGINSTQDFILTNNGTISAAGNNEGISSTGGSSFITNSFGALISGDDDGIYFSTDGGTITNNGTISGILGAFSDGIHAGDLLVVSNNSGAFIDGFKDGINAGNSLSLTNAYNATVSGGSAGINALDNALVNNQGTIEGGDGINVGDFATINNETYFNPFFPFQPLDGGTISGTAGDGVTAGENLTLVNQNLATIDGVGGDGISAGNNANITNHAGATITSLNNDGINALNGSTITNNGVINGGDDAIDIDNGIAAPSIIRNTGTLTAGTGSALDGSNSVEEFTNSGTLNGGSDAISLRGGDDIVNLEFGSRVIGDVDGGTGIDTLNFEGGLSTPGGTGNSISGDVTRFADINKNQGGVALIGVDGDPLYNVTADNININGGGLYINADITGDSVAKTTINAAGAAVGGTGTWNADVNITSGGISAGAIPINLDVVPNNSVGTLGITGNVVHNPTSFIRVDIDPQGGPGGFDQIVQTGVGNTYDMGGGYVRIASTDNNQVIQDGSRVIVQSDELIVGTVQSSPSVQFNQNVSANDTGFIGNQAFIGGGNNQDTVLGSIFSTVTVIGNQIVLDVTHNYEGLGTTSNAAAIGGALDASVGSLNPLTQDFISALDYSDLATVQATLNGLAPDSTFSSSLAIVSGNYRLHRLVQDHLALTRSGGDSYRSYVGTSNSVPAPAPQQVRNSGLGNVWGNVTYAWKDVDGGANRNFDGEEASFTAGVDYRVAPDFLLGLVLDGSTADYDFSGGSSDVDSFRAAIYGTYGAATGVYADFLAGWGTHDIDHKHNGGLLGPLRSSTDATSFQALLTVGYAMQADAIKHGPFVGLEYQNVDVDGYTQGGLFPIGVRGYDVDSLRLLAGYRAEANYGKFNPYLSVTYAHEFKDDSIQTTAFIPGGAGFGVAGNGPGSAVLISLGANYALSSSLSANLGYHGEISVDSGEGTDSHGASIGLNYAF